MERIFTLIEMELCVLECIALSIKDWRDSVYLVA